MCYKCNARLDEIRRSVLRTCRDARQCEREWLGKAEDAPASADRRAWFDNCNVNASWWRHRRMSAVAEYRLWRDIERAAGVKRAARRCPSCGV